jgi:RNA polymerase sigma factor (sigma-70 family)
MEELQSRHERFKTVVLPHLGEAAGMARRCTRNRADADDVLQENAVRLLRFIGTYRGGDARSWVLRVTRNTAFTWLRRNRRPYHMALADTEDDKSADPWWSDEHPERNDPYDIEARRSDSLALRQAIDRLPCKQREIVILRDLNGLPYSEIASELRIPLGTVMSRLSRTHAELRLRLGPAATS